jgi:hypothetical protein
VVRDYKTQNTQWNGKQDHHRSVSPVFWFRMPFVAITIPAGRRIKAPLSG